MKTRKTTRVSFSADPPTLDIRLPESWAELTQRELVDVCSIMSHLSEAKVRSAHFPLFRYFTGLKILSCDGDIFTCRIKAHDVRHNKIRRIICKFSPVMLAELLDPLDFVLEPGSVPVRPDSWHGARAVDAQFHGVTFGTYLQIENLYQGFISSHNPAALVSLARLLYPGIKERHIDAPFIYAMLQWLVQVKGLFARMWHNFFKPATGESSAPSMLDVMNNEIRALTGGDVSKEEVIFEIDCWRALTELDFKARETEEMKRKLAKPT